MEPLKKRVEQLITELNQATQKLDIDKKSHELKKIREEMQKPGFWSDTKKAQDLTKLQNTLKNQTELWRVMLENAKELKSLLDLKDESLNEEIVAKLEEIEKEYNENKKLNRFQGPFDDHDVILSIYAGAGGTDAQDWAQMLLRMYVPWAESHKLKVETIDQSTGEETGIKIATIKVSGRDFLYVQLSRGP